MAKDSVVTKQFTFNIAESSEPSIELIQLISQAIQSYDTNSSPVCNVAAVIKYFACEYGVRDD